MLDKAVALLRLIEQRPMSLAELVAEGGYSRATTHRLATALVDHGMLRRDDVGQYRLGLAHLSFGRAAAAELPLADLARPILVGLRDETGESAQIYVRDGEQRVCIASRASLHGLRTIVETGSVLPLNAGSGGAALLDTEGRAAYASVAEREAGVASVSAPVRNGGAVVAAISISGPIERLGDDPLATFGPTLHTAALALQTRAFGSSDL